MLDWAREQGCVDDWRKVALLCVGLVSTIGAKWRCCASGCSELLARQRRSDWRHGALEEDNASLALAGCV